MRSCLSHSVLLVADNLIQALEKKVNDLIELSRELNRENRALKLRAAELQRERRELLERQRQASEHVETSLARLRSLDGSA
ncbi:MAG: hypothetical protein EVA63_00050 [Halieaceae bacterium]|nr:MAG: hypothetical protein EVA63_00050 [Halieaceae bacterium]